MRLRYLLLALNGFDVDERVSRSISERTALPVVHRAQNLLLFASRAEDVLILPRGEGLLIGTLFHRRGPPQRISEISTSDEVILREKSGRSIIDRYWGSFVAVHPVEDGVRVLRDPSGGLSCYFSSSKSFTAFSSDLELLTGTGLTAASIDWSAIGRILYLHQLPPQHTAVDGVEQLFPGCAITVGSGESKSSQCWSPWDYVEPGSYPETNSEKLKRVVTATVSAWASCYPKPLLGLSGGLDSSILAYCLVAARTNLTCLTLTTADAIGDESQYAQQVCDSIGANLVREPYRIENIDLEKSVAAGTPIPCAKAHEQAHNQVVRNAVERLGADSFFTGAGGDNVFYLTHSARPLVDRYRSSGVSRDTLTTLLDICSITGASAWQVLMEALRLPRSLKPGLSWHVVPDYLHPEFVASEQNRQIEHPWLRPPDRTPLGKLGHVTMLLRAMNHIEHRDKALSVPMISPLLSQPVVELCLSIPSWEACSGGQDRSVARRAFASVLPAKIIDRRGKGSPDGFVANFIELQRQKISERLLDGHLASHNLLDRAALENTLRPGASIAPSDCPRIMALLDTEAWAQRWSSPVLPGHGLPSDGVIFQAR